MYGLANEAALPCDADSGSRIVASHHPYGEMGVPQCLNGRGCAWLQLVLKNDQAEKFEARFGLLSVIFVLGAWRMESIG